MTSVPARAPLKSFLKWAGGKARSAATITAMAPPGGFRTYLEPFCGSAAVFFAVQPPRAVLADANEELVACLRQVAEAPHAVMQQLDAWPNTREFFRAVRDWDPHALSPAERAARVIYLNKTAFRGLWRVNRQGRFNVPYGEYDRPYYNPDTLLAASGWLRRAEIRHACFRETLARCVPGDWVYVDPPYVPDRRWGDFTRYTPGRFGPADQRDLAEILRRLDRAGVYWLLTNSDTPAVRELYAGFRQAVLPTRRDITLRSADRPSADLLVTNYAPARGGSARARSRSGP